MERADVDGVTLEYEVAGAGEPVVFIHGTFIADPFRPLLAEPSLADRYRLIAYHRRGYAGSSRASGPVSVARQAADCRALIRHLGVESAHVVGHSFGGCIALQLALDAPDVVHSLALLEPALMLGASAQPYREALWARFGEVHRLLLAWLPDAEGFVLPDTTHFLHLESPRASAGLAEGLAAFFARHPLDRPEN
jgi:pimeloyl-ACP methyl ester carboxylesterase